MKGRAEGTPADTAKTKKKQAKKLASKPLVSKVLKEKKVKKGKEIAVKPAGVKEVKAKKVVEKKLVAKPAPKKQSKAKSSTLKKVVENAAPKKEAANKRVLETKAKVSSEPQLKLRNAVLIVEPSKRRKIRKTKVVMEGDLNINNVDAYIQQVKPLFEDYDFIDFFLREATSLDLCHLQMLYYFQNHFAKQGKTVTVDADLTPDFRKIIINNGFKEFMFIPKLV